MKILVEDGTEEVFEMGEEQELLELYPFVLLNTDEIASTIAYDYFDEESVDMSTIAYDIDLSLDYIWATIRDKTEDLLIQNGVKIIN